MRAISKDKRLLKVLLLSAAMTVTLGYFTNQSGGWV